MTITYHFAQMRLHKASILEPGNFGRLLQRYSPPPPGGQGFGNPWLRTREMIFEQARPAAKPTRFECCYVLPSLEDAQRCRAVNDRLGLQVLHEVEFVDPSAAMHSGALSYLEMFDGQVFLEPTRAAAAQYWASAKGDANFGTEIFTLSPLTVVRAVE